MKELSFEQYLKDQSSDGDILFCDCGCSDWTLNWNGTLECSDCEKVEHRAKWYRLCEIE